MQQLYKLRVHTQPYIAIYLIASVLCIEISAGIS